LWRAKINTKIKYKKKWVKKIKCESIQGTEKSVLKEIKINKERK
jgi:hypothetical protein